MPRTLGVHRISRPSSRMRVIRLAQCRTVDQPSTTLRGVFARRVFTICLGKLARSARHRGCAIVVQLSKNCRFMMRLCCWRRRPGFVPRQGGVAAILRAAWRGARAALLRSTAAALVLQSPMPPEPGEPIPVRPLLLTPMSRIVRPTTRQNSRHALHASLRPWARQLMACTLTIGYAARHRACCRSPTLFAGSTRRVSLASGGSSWEPWSPQRCTWLR